MSITKQTEQKMNMAVEHLKDELKGIRTGHANPAMLDNVIVEAYGAQMKIRDLATVSSPESRQLLISPFDPSTKDAIAKGIEKANIGIRPVVDGHVVRINIPPMDESMRKEMVKICHKKREEAKVGVRNVRRDSNELVRKQKANGDIPEDMMKKFEKEIQDLTDKFCKICDDVSAAKEKEITHI
jgi:ribosome recycling factor